MIKRAFLLIHLLDVSRGTSKEFVGYVPRETSLY